jgi:hypothetical protein
MPTSPITSACNVTIIPDVDGVLYNYVRRIGDIAAVELRRPRTDFPPAGCWNFMREEWLFTMPEFFNLTGVAVKKHGFIRHGHPFPDSFEGLALLERAGCSIHFATDIGFEDDHDGVRAARVAWLRDHGIDFTSPRVNITFTPDKAAVASAEIARGQHVFAIDDKVENYLELTKAGATTYLLDQKWNAHHDTINRVATVRDFAHQVLATIKS